MQFEGFGNCFPRIFLFSEIQLKFMKNKFKEFLSRAYFVKTHQDTQDKQLPQILPFERNININFLTW